MAQLKEFYQSKLAPQLHKELKLANVHQVPRIEKVVVNVGLGRALQDNRLVDVATNTLRKITGQQPVQTKAKKSIAGFKLREGAVIGLKVTLRGERMYEFLERLIRIVLPRTRDFRGLSASAFDPQGNYSLGLRDQSVFPELTYEDTTIAHGLQINVITNTDDTAAARSLLQGLGLPFERSENG